MSASSKEVGGLGRGREARVRSERDPCWDYAGSYSRVVRVSDSFLGEVGGARVGLGACRGCCGCQGGNAGDQYQGGGG